MEELSEQYIKNNCPHCDRTSSAYTYTLLLTEHFSVVCDLHCLEQGHILIIPKKHFSCIADYPPDVYKEFLQLYGKIEAFETEVYASSASFEHGVLGQTVFHSHVHFLPFAGSPTEIVPEGPKYLRSIPSVDSLKRIFFQVCAKSKKSRFDPLFLSIFAFRLSILLL